MSKPTSAVKRRYNKKTYDTANAYLRKGQLKFLKGIAAEHDTTVSKLIINSLTQYLDTEFGIDFNDFPQPDESE